jgi:hypothetical protein
MGLTMGAGKTYPKRIDATPETAAVAVMKSRFKSKGISMNQHARSCTYSVGNRYTPHL